MDPRSFDGLTKAISRHGSVSRRRLLRGVAAVGALSLLPAGVRARATAVDAPPPVVPAGGGVACTAGADCAAGEVCLNGVCQPLAADATGTLPADPADPAAGGVRVIQTPVPADGTTPVPGTETTPIGGSGRTPAGETPEPAGLGGQISPDQPLFIGIYPGVCGELDVEPTFELLEFAPLDAAAQEVVGSLLAIPARSSTNILDTTLADLLADAAAVDVRLDAADPATSIACGNVGGILGGQISDTELAIGLGEQSASGYAGIAWFREQDATTVVDVFVAQGLEEGADLGGILAPQTGPVATEEPADDAADVVIPTAVPAADAESVVPEPTVRTLEPGAAAATPAPAAALDVAVGDLVATVDDVNLRAEPSTDAAVVEILGLGAELEVTGAPADGWIPVTTAAGTTGFVAAEFVQAVG